MIKSRYSYFEIFLGGVPVGGRLIVKQIINKMSLSFIAFTSVLKEVFTTHDLEMGLKGKAVKK